MGNCLFGGLGEEMVNRETIKVVTSNGGVMELHAPLTADTIIAEFPNHAIFRTHDLFYKPLLHHDELLPGESYNLLPLKNTDNIVRQKYAVRSNSTTAPYRMSFDNPKMLKRSYTDAFSRSYGGGNNLGIWKVKLVISSEQLMEILSREGSTHELIESVRTVAKCGTSNNGGSSSMAFSDQWSLSSSRNASSSSKNETLL